MSVIVGRNRQTRSMVNLRAPVRPLPARNTVRQFTVSSLSALLNYALLVEATICTG